MLIERGIVNKLFAELDTPDILILLGSRQVGKTSILKILQQKLEEMNRKCIFLDLDMETNLEYFSSYMNIINYIRFQGFDAEKDRIYLFLDEFHRVQGAGKTLKNLYDHHSNIKVIATGSSSLEVSSTISESMSGRKLVFRVFPLSFRELLVFRQAEKLIPVFDRFQVGDEFPGIYFTEYEPYAKEKLIFGSFPEAVLESNLERKTRKIEDILNSYLRKDIKEQLAIRDTVLYKKVMELLAIAVSNLLNLNNIAKELGAYHKKVSEFTHIATETYLLDLLRPYAKNRKNEIIRNPKVYFEDTGMRNFLIRNMNMELMLRMDTGALVENFVYNELTSHMDIFSELKFWRTKSDTEIDFLLIKNREILPIEVKSGSYTKIPKSLASFCEKEQLSKAVIITKDVSMKLTKNGIDFYYVPYIFSSKLMNLLNR